MNAKWLIVIFVLVSLACGQSVGVVESPKPKRASVPMGGVSTVTEIPKRDLCGDVNVRAKPEPTGRVLRWLKAGEKVEVIEIRDGWARIGQQEWIIAEVLCR